jgi:4-amino-4-deoxy-L-arabinose transferase-like glycosyltransferase
MMLRKKCGQSTVSNFSRRSLTLIYNSAIVTTPIHRLRFLALFGVNLVWGIALWWSVSTFGLGTSRDSIEYLFTSLSLTRGDGLVSFLGQRYVLWPPLYPALLSLFQRIGGMNPLDAALALQLLTFVWIAGLTAWLFTRLFPRTLALAFLGNALALTGVGLTMLFQAVGSDYLFIALTLSMVYLCDAYMTENRLSILVWMTIVSALAMLQRYIGVTLLLTAAWVVLWYSRATLVVRLQRTALLGLSFLPVGGWVLSLPVEAVVRNDPSNLFENFHWFTFSILSWFVPDAELYDHPFRTQVGMWGLWAGVVACGAVVWRCGRNREANDSVEVPLFLFGGVYTVLLLVIASLTSFNTLDSRFASPVFIPLVALVLSAMERILFSEFPRVKPPPVLMYAVVFLPLLVVLGLSVMRSVTVMRFQHENGGGYTSREWYNNDVIAYWLAHKPAGEYLVFSNYPAGLAVHTWHVALSSPRRTDHPNAGEAVIPLEVYLPSLFEAGKESYVVWIEPNEYTHVYSVEELRTIVKVKVVYESAEGGVYRIEPLR